MGAFFPREREGICSEDLINVKIFIYRFYSLRENSINAKGAILFISFRGNPSYLKKSNRYIIPSDMGNAREIVESSLIGLFNLKLKKKCKKERN